MGGHELMDSAVQERLQRLEDQVRTDKVMVALSPSSPVEV